MVFTLEALEAKYGDCLLLHFGSKKEPQTIVIDGGPAGVYKNTLSRRLLALKAGRSPQGPLPIRMVMVSHIDDDHINGVLKLFQELDDLRRHGKQLPFQVATLWHNSFDDILNNAAEEMSASLQPAVRAASTGAAMPAGLPLARPGALVLASVSQGRDLRNLATALGLNINEGFGKLVMAPAGAAAKPLPLGGGLSFTVLGPEEARLRKLQVEWDTQIKKLGVAKVAEFVDQSVYNLSSMIVLAGNDAQTMLLTGDARGDEILAGLKRGNLFRNGVCHVDVLKLPHHGSSRNISAEFFRQVTADHYVCSGNGQYDNPEPATLGMILEARGSAKYSIHLTNQDARLVAFFKKQKTAGRNYHVVYREPNRLGVQVDLAEPAPG